MSRNAVLGSGKIKFKNMEDKRVGNALRELRKRQSLSLEELALKAGIDSIYLNRLEEGCQPIVDRTVIDKILKACNIRFRGIRSNEELLTQLLCISPANPPYKLM